MRFNIGKLKNAISSAKEQIAFSSIIEITDNNYAVVQGIEGVNEYNDNSIRIKIKKHEVLFWGEQLSIKFLADDIVELTGKISRVEYL